MKVLLIAHAIPPLNKVSSKRIFQIAQALHFLGVEVHLLSSKKYSIDGEDGYDADLMSVISTIHFIDYPKFIAKTLNSRSKNKSKGEIENNSFFYTYIKNIKNILGNIFEFRDFLITESNINYAIDLIDRLEIDVVISSYNPSFVHKFSSKLKLLRPSIFWVADFRDLWVGNHNQKLSTPYLFISRFVERYYLKNANLITSVSNGFIDKIKETHGIHRDYYLLPNGFYPDELLLKSSKLPQSIEYVFSRYKKVLVYTGMLYDNHQNPKVIIDSFNLFINQIEYCDVAIIFVGNNIPNSFNGVNCRHLYLFEQVSKSVCNQIIQRASALLILDWESQYDGVIPAKVFDYMASGKPIVLHQHFPRKSELKNMLIECNYHIFLSSVDDWKLFFTSTINNLKCSDGIYDVGIYDRREQVKGLLAKIAKLNEKIN